MSDIINPFVAGNPITGSEMFFGREDIFQFIRQTLIGQHRDNVVVLYWHRQRMSQIEVRDVDEVLEEATERGSAVLKYGWEELTLGEKAIVAGMATAMGQDN